MNIASFAVRHERIFAIALSLAAGIAWFFACNFDKSLTVYHDEVTYTESARDIYNGLSPLLQHLRPSYFSKVFYSYLIAPGFAFSDPTLWQTFLNAVFSGLTVFFTWLCSRLLIESGGLRVACTLLTALLPIYSYAVYATPDCLFFCETALDFLVFTALCRGIIDGVRIRTVLLMSVLLGMVSFIAYFTKEVAAAFVISEIAMLAVAHLIVGGKKREFILSAAAAALTFLLLFLYLKFILIPEIAVNSYQQQMIPFQAYLEAEGWHGLAYKFLYMATGACFSVYLIPLLSPVFEFRRLPPAGRLLCLTAISSFVLLTLAVIYLITWREDFAREYPLWQFRYHGAYLPAFLVLTVLAFENRSSAAVRTVLRVGVLAVFLLAMLLFYPVPDEQLRSVYDNATINLFNYSLYFDATDLDLRIRQKISLFLLLLSVSVLSLPFMAAWERRAAVISGVVSLNAACILFLITGCYYTYVNREENGIPESLRSDAIELASFLDRLKPDVRIILAEKDRTPDTSSFYTYTRRPAMSVPVSVFLRDSAQIGCFDFSVPHRIGISEFGYNSRYLSAAVIMPAPDLIVETGNAYVEFPGKEPVFLSRNRHYAVIFNGREACLPVKQENQTK